VPSVLPRVFLRYGRSGPCCDAIRYKLYVMKNGEVPSAGKQKGIIIIGADGFIGSSINAYLKQSGWNVFPTVFDKEPADGELKLDVGSYEDFKSLPRGIPLINTAGLPDQSAPASLMRRVHVRGMKNLVNWARSTACPHIIHTSSVSVYGNATIGTGRTENSTPRRKWNPLTAPIPYGRTKARGEAILEKSGLPWSAPRLPAVYGPGDSFLTPQLRRLLVDSDRLLPPGGEKNVSLMPVDQTGPLMESILDHGPLNAALNAAAVHIPWKTLLDSYARVWDITLNFDTRRRIRDYMNFADPGRQMAVYYAAYGAEFPDKRIREILNWEPEGDWRETVREAGEADQK